MNLQNTKKTFLFWFSLLIIGGYPQFSFSQFGIIWEESYGGSIWEELNGVVPMEDHCSYVFGGMTSSNGSFTVQSPSIGGADVWLVWTDTMGTFNQNISCSNIQYGEKRYGGNGNDRLQSLKRTSDGGLVFVGTTDSHDLINPQTGQLEPNFGFTDFYVAKLDAYGNMEWQRTLGGNGFDFGMAVVPTEDNKYLVCGTSFSDTVEEDMKIDSFYGGSDIWAFLLDEHGIIEWANSYGGDSTDTVTAAVVAVEDSEPGFIIGGATFSDGTSGNLNIASEGKQDWVYFKIDKDNGGEIIWQKGQGMEGQDDILDILVTNDDQYFISGFSERNPDSTLAFGKEDAYFMKVDRNGNKVWDQIYGGDELDWGYSAVQNGLGNYVVVCVSASDTSAVKDASQIAYRDYWVMHLDSNGDKLWDQSFGGDHDDSCTKVAKAIGGGYILGGHSQSDDNHIKSDPNYGMNDMWVIRTGCNLGNPQLPDLVDICEGEEIFIDATATPCEGCTYLWHDGHLGPVREIDTEVDLTEYSVLIVHKDACETMDTFTVETVPNPTAVMVQVDSVTCFGDNDGAFYFEGVLNGTPPFTAFINDEEYTNLEAIPDFFGLAAGVFEIEVYDSNNCFTDTTVVIETPDEPLVLLPDGIEIDLGDSIQINGLATPNVTSFYWTIPDLLSCDTCLNPWIAPTESLSIGLVGEDKNGCETRDVMGIIVDRNVELHIPNIFSPNGDGHNDYFTAFSDKGVRRIITFQVFDRWGQSMFSRTDIPLNVVQLGWDGTYRGKTKDVGVYAYFMEVEYLDGRIEMIKGDVVLAK